MQGNPLQNGLFKTDRQITQRQIALNGFVKGTRVHFYFLFLQKLCSSEKETFLKFKKMTVYLRSPYNTIPCMFYLTNWTFVKKREKKRAYHYSV
jgi:hypothetical protein